MSDNRLERMRELVNYLNKAAHAYYVMDNPVISDMQYDKLYDELRALEAETKSVLPDSPTVRVGDATLKEFEQHRHNYRSEVRCTHKLQQRGPDCRQVRRRDAFGHV